MSAISMMSVEMEALQLHRRLCGKIEVKPKIEATAQNMSLIYTPGVAQVSRVINKNLQEAYKLTGKANTIAIVCDGTRVLGLGDVGPEAGLAVMEGKSVLFKHFANVDAVPICIKKSSAKEIIEFVERISPGFGGINLEDIETPKCLEVNRELRERLDIPVFHDDQWGTAIVVLAGLINAMKVVGKELEKARIIICGGGAAGMGIAKILHEAGARGVIVCDSRGAISRARKDLNEFKKELASITNQKSEQGYWQELIEGADVYIGVTGVEGILKEEHVRKMADNAIVFPLTNPNPEIMPERAFKAGAKVVGTGRSDYSNQLNNSLVFPGLFRGALDVRASKLDKPVYIAAAQALAGLVGDNELKKGKIVPHIMEKDVVPAVSQSVKETCIKLKIAKIK